MDGKKNLVLNGMLADPSWELNILIVRRLNKKYQISIQIHSILD